jgi:hypothetical protein
MRQYPQRYVSTFFTFLELEESLHIVFSKKITLVLGSCYILMPEQQQLGLAKQVENRKHLQMWLSRLSRMGQKTVYILKRCAIICRQHLSLETRQYWHKIDLGDVKDIPSILWFSEVVYKYRRFSFSSLPK